jgi:predicted methyltransferase
MNLPINQIICGDCLEVMKTFPDKSVDLVLTDPPYGINVGVPIERERELRSVAENRLVKVGGANLSFPKVIRGSMILESRQKKFLMK